MSRPCIQLTDWPVVKLVVVIQTDNNFPLARFLRICGNVPSGAAASCPDKYRRSGCVLRIASPSSTQITVLPESLIASLAVFLVSLNRFHGRVSVPMNRLPSGKQRRIFETIFKEGILPTPKHAILIALMHAAEGFKLLLEQEDYEDEIERINLLAKLDLVGRTVTTAVENSTVQPRRKRSGTKSILEVRVMDILRQRDFFKGNIARGLQGIHINMGPS